jgi:hypothetical protein
MTETEKIIKLLTDLGCFYSEGVFHHKSTGTKFFLKDIITSNSIFSTIFIAGLKKGKDQAQNEIQKAIGLNGL